MIKPPPAEFKPKLCKQKGYWESPPHGTSTVECETIHFILFTIKETVQLLGVQQLLKDDIYPASKGFIRARPQTERVEGKKAWSGGGGGGEQICPVFIIKRKLYRITSVLSVFVSSLVSCVSCSREAKTCPNTARCSLHQLISHLFYTA